MPSVTLVSQKWLWEAQELYWVAQGWDQVAQGWHWDTESALNSWLGCFGLERTFKLIYPSPAMDRDTSHLPRVLRAPASPGHWAGTGLAIEGTELIGP